MPFRELVRLFLLAGIIASVEISFLPFRGVGSLFDLTIPLAAMVLHRNGLRQAVTFAMMLGFFIDAVSPFSFGTWTVGILSAVIITDAILSRVFTRHIIFAAVPLAAALSAPAGMMISTAWSWFSQPFARSLIHIPVTEIALQNIMFGFVSAFVLTAILETLADGVKRLAGIWPHRKPLRIKNTV